MGALILATGICNDKAVTSSIASSILAGKQAMQKANVQAEDVAVVINVGVFRDKNMVEPAMAALIQKELGMNPDYIKAATGKDAFSLDLMNGGIGALYAMRVADSMLQSDATRYVLIVGADAHPSNKEVKEFPYRNVGSAFLLGKGKDAKKGFQNFQFDTEVRKDWGRVAKVNTTTMGTRGRDLMTMNTADDYVTSLLDFSSRKAKEFIAKHSLKANEQTLISSELNAEFQASLGKSIGVTQNVPLYQQFGDTYTSSFALGFHQAQSKLNAGAQVLFVGATSGLTAGCVHYVC